LEIGIHVVVINDPKGQNKEIEIWLCNKKDLVSVFKYSRELFCSQKNLRKEHKTMGARDT